MAKNKSNQSYNQMFAELQSIIDWFESDDVNLDDAIEKYKKANDLINQLEHYLKTAENKVRKVATK